MDLHYKLYLKLMRSHIIDSFWGILNCEQGRYKRLNLG